MEYHSGRFSDYSLLVFDDQELIAVLPANSSDGNLISHQGLSYGGLVLHQKIMMPKVLLALQEILSFLDSEGIKTLTLKLLPKIYHSLPSDEMDYLLFILNANLSRRDITSVIDNNNKLNVESSNRKRGIKKGIKSNLRIQEQEDLSSFWNEILIPNLKATHNTSPVHSINEITKLKSQFPKHIKQFNVYSDDKIVGGTTIFETENVAHVQYISANQDKQILGSLDFLFDYLINEHYKDIRYFDFGISNENQGKKVNKGLLSWKESFGGRSISHDFYKIETKNHINLNDLMI
jgi:hypothetical protein